MRLCFIADYGSPTASNWIGHFAQLGHEVHVLSTGAWTRKVGAVAVHGLGGASESRASRRRGGRGLADPNTLLGKVSTTVWRSAVLPYRLCRFARTVQERVVEIRPDLLHCLRIPIEGELGMLSGFRPLLVSIWGNDLTLYSERSWFHRVLTYRVLRSADGVLADCRADLDRAIAMANTQRFETLVVPGGAGIRSELFRPGLVPPQVRQRFGISWAARVVLNARGVRAYTRHDTVFAAMRRVVGEFSDAVLVCVGLKGWAPAEKWIAQHQLGGRAILTEPLDQEEMSMLYRAAEVCVSITEHDGTPNSLLEAMASGAVPICGDLPSIREWIVPGINGDIVRADAPEMLATAIIGCLRDPGFCHKAAEYNQHLIRERATYPRCMSSVEQLYNDVVQRHRRQPAEEPRSRALHRAGRHEDVV
jgi:glycosyltransferase involved in cell wall biosynthesis